MKYKYSEVWKKELPPLPCIDFRLLRVINHTKMSFLPVEALNPNEYAIGFIDSGAATYCKNEQKYELREGSIYVNYPKETRFLRVANEETFNSYAICIIGNIEPILERLHLTRSTPTLQLSQYSDTAEAFRNFAFEYLECASPNLLREYKYFFEILDLIQQCPSEDEDPPSRLIKQVNTLFERNRDIPYNVSSICEYLKVSPSTLSKASKQHLGISISAYLESLRMTRIKRLLKETDFKLAYIASRVHYCHERYLIDRFKKAEGITPTEWRKRNQ